MNSDKLNEEGGAKVGRASLTLDAALIYEDLSTGIRARYVLECVAGLFPRAPRFNMAMWRFDMLRMAEVRQKALKAASAAVIVLLSAHGSGALPRAVRVWFLQWLERKSDQPSAMLICLDEKSRESVSAAQMISWLQTEANTRDVAVFPGFGMTPYSEGDPAVEALQRSVHTNVATLDGIQRWPGLRSGWGINE
jgi:hypothetical protein